MPSSESSANHASEEIGLTPPAMFRNCAGGFTCNGRTARTSCPRSGALPRLRTT
jgi:hypothetical protein